MNRKPPPKQSTRCPICGKKDLIHEIRPVKFNYKGHSIIVQQPGTWCNACGEAILEGKDQKATRNELQAFRASVDNLLTPDEIYRIRKKKLHLTQRQASSLFGGGPNSFGRYERGEVPPPKPLSHLFKILDKHPNQLEEIQKHG